ncbi:MAG: HPP family protein [Pseudomonadota bacterium]
MRQRFPSLRVFLHAFRPMPLQVDGAERLRALVGAGLGILMTALLCRWWASHGAPSPWIVAPIGASAVLIFAVPSSPLAQPWPVIAGNTMSACVGALCAMVVPDPALAGALAVALAIGLMFMLRCLHPPGGASALLAALGGVGFQFSVFPMLANSVLLVAVGVAYNCLTGRTYPHSAAPAAPASSVGESGAARFSTADLDLALARYNQVLDVSRDDLEQLLHHAEAAAYQRRFGDLRCSDVMTPAPHTVQFGTPLDEAWASMLAHRVKALPVIDRARRIVGIVTTADFMRHAQAERLDGIGLRLRQLVQRSGLVHSEKPEVVGQIMTREVRVASASRRAADLVPLFSHEGHHHIPILDDQQRLVGILTQSDLIRALFAATRPA